MVGGILHLKGLGGEVSDLLGEKAEVVYKNLECSPCSSKTIKRECLGGDPECKRLITVEDVLSAIEKICFPPVKINSPVE